MALQTAWRFPIRNGHRIDPVQGMFHAVWTIRSAVLRIWAVASSSANFLLGPEASKMDVSGACRFVRVALKLVWVAVTIAVYS